MGMILPDRLRLTHRVLKKPAKPWTFESPARSQNFAEHMLKFMHDQGGIGLAAPQIGVSRRLFVMHLPELGTRICFNPEIHWPTEDQTITIGEGCLSFPGDSVFVTRPRKILARYQDSQGNWHEEELEELAAVCYQHEHDHLDGITMHDRKDS